MYKSNGKLYWYGAGNEILAETDASGNTTAEYIFFGGKRQKGFYNIRNNRAKTKLGLFQFCLFRTDARDLKKSIDNVFSAVDVLLRCFKTFF